jgi:hypothetical protein
MTLPRWLVVSLLSASLLAVLGAGAWWWVTWPVRTITEVERLITAGDRYALKKVIQPQVIYQPSETGESVPWLITQPIQPANAIELTVGERRFGPYPHENVWLVKRGRIVLNKLCTNCH